MSNLTVRKTYSNNPFIDYLLYYTKILAFGSVIKDSDEAEANESHHSAMMGDTLIACMENNYIFELFDYDKDIMQQVGLKGDGRVNEFAKDHNMIPDIIDEVPLIKTINKKGDTVYKYDKDDPTEYNIGDFIQITGLSVSDAFRNYKVCEFPDGSVKGVYNLRKELAYRAANKFIATYREENNYYRMICGLPAIGDYGIPLMDYEYFDINGIQEFINNEGATYLHELSQDQIRYLDYKGVLDQIKADYPECKYLDYITCGLTPYKVRKAYEYQLLYIPEINGNAEIVYEKFKSKYEENRLYVMATWYNDAFKYTSTHYTNFIAMMIMIMTISDILGEVHTDIIKRDLLDKRCIQYIFEQYNIPYYNSIPLKYQYRMCKNINKLIRYKSSPMGMVNIIDLFGAENIEVFKYFILRDRKVDKWGELIYNEMERKESVFNTTLVLNRQTILATTGEKYPLDISDEYKRKEFTTIGNKILVWKDTELLEEGTDYSITNKDEIYITKPGLVGTELELEIYTNRETLHPYIDKTHGVQTEIEMVLIDNKTRSAHLSNFNTFYPSILISGNDVYMVADGNLYTEGKNTFTIDRSASTITLNNAFPINDLMIKIIYVFNPNMKTKISQYEIPVVNNTADISKVLPFTTYITDKNPIILQSTDALHKIIPTSEFSINEKGIISLPSTAYKKILVNFIYSSNTVFDDIDIQYKTEEFIATEDYQVTFKLHPPIENYFKLGYRVGVTLRKQTSMLDSSLYDVFNNTLTIRDMSIGLRKGQRCMVTYAYGPSSDNIQCKVEKIIPKHKEQKLNDTFTIHYPENIPKKTNRIVVSVSGNILQPNQYTIADDQLTILNVLDRPTDTQYVEVCYYYNFIDSKKIAMKQERIICTTTGQSEFTVNPPFTPYQDTNNDVLVFINSVPDIGYSITDTTIRFNSTVLEEGDTIDILYFYNYKYIKDKESQKVPVFDSSPISVMDVNNDLQIKVPFPFKLYLENDWFMYVSYADSPNTRINESEYTILDGMFSFNDPHKHAEDKHIVFHFIYLDDPRFVKNVIEEDYDADIDLKFIGVPITEEYFNKDLIRKNNVLSYDTVTVEDDFWDGVSYTDETNAVHQKVKAEILAKKFNYERTKYFGINYVYNIAEMSFNVAYFYNIFFDDVFKEDKLAVKVPSIAPYKEFKLAYLFCYMNALGYLYSGVEDTIINTLSKVLYINGFNFKADIPALKKWIWDQRRDPDNFDSLFIYNTLSNTLPKNRTRPIWDFNNKPGENNVFESIDELVSMFKNTKKPISNKGVYDFIVKNIYKSQNKDIYDIWKKILDSLMTYRQSFDFYKINDGTETRIANSLTEFLKYKDTELYTDLMEIKNIKDTNRKKEIIIDRISDIVFILQEYLDSSNFKNIFDPLPGVSGEFFLDMLFTIINFFKSYKIVLRSKGDYIVFDASDPYLNTIRPIDLSIPDINLNKYEYIDPFNMSSTMLNSTHYYEKMGFKEYIDRQITIENSINPKYDKVATNNNLPKTNITNVIIKVPKNQIISVVTSSGKVFTTNTKQGELFAANPINIGDKNRITYYLFQKKGDITKEYAGFTLDDDTTEHRYIFYSEELPSGFITKDLDNGKEYPYSNKSEEIEELTEIRFTLTYGEELYVYIEPDEGFIAGKLNMHYAIARDKDIVIKASEALPITKFVSVSPVPFVNIFILNSTGELMGPKNTSVEVPLHGLVTIAADGVTGAIHPKLIINGEKITDDHFTTSITKDIQVSAYQKENPPYTVKIIAPNHQTIRFSYGNKYIVVPENTETELQIETGTLYSIILTADTRYNPGVLNNPAFGKISGAIDDNPFHITFTASEASIKQFNVNIEQSIGQKVYVVYNGETYEDTLTVPIYTELSAVVEAEDGYQPGRPLKNKYIVVSDTTISAMPAKPTEYTIILNTKPHQELVFSYDGNSVTCDDPNTPIILKGIFEGDEYIIEVNADEGFTSGSVSIPMTGIIRKELETRPNEINISVSDTNQDRFSIIIQQSAHQLITATYNGHDYTESFIAPYNAEIHVRIESTDEEFSTGKLNTGEQFVVTQDTIISASMASNTLITVSLAQTPHQTIIAKEINTYDNSVIKTFSEESFAVPFGTTLEFVVVPENDFYIAGNPSINKIDRITTDTTITAEEAHLRMITIALVQNSNQTITLHIGDSVYTTTSTIDVPIGTEYSLAINASEGYVPGTLNVPKKGHFIKDTVIMATAATQV